MADMVTESKLRSIRLARRLSQEHVSRLADVTRDTVGNIERGRVTASFGTQQRIAAALDLPVEVVFPAADAA